MTRKGKKASGGASWPTSAMARPSKADHRGASGSGARGDGRGDGIDAVAEPGRELPGLSAARWRARLVAGRLGRGLVGVLVEQTYNLRAIDQLAGCSTARSS